MDLDGRGGRRRGCNARWRPSGGVWAISLAEEGQSSRGWHFPARRERRFEAVWNLASLNRGSYQYSSRV